MLSATLLLVCLGPAAAAFNVSGHRRCTKDQAHTQTARLRQRFAEKWAHSACPSEDWFELLRETGFWEWRLNGFTRPARERRLVMYDIGCNKGYKSAHLLSAFRREASIFPAGLFKAISHIIRKEKMELDRPCGVCNDCGVGRGARVGPTSTNVHMREGEPDLPVTVHCFEPSVPLHKLLLRARSTLCKLSSTSGICNGHPPVGSDGAGAAAEREVDARMPEAGDEWFAAADWWFIHNVGVHRRNTTLFHDTSCSHEKCVLGAKAGPGMHPVQIVSVDEWHGSRPGPVDLIKIDTEGSDPAVLKGAMATLAQWQPLVSFEYNPGLSAPNMWRRVSLTAVVKMLDDAGYDCYYDSDPRGDGGKGSVPRGPALYLITGGCLRSTTAGTDDGVDNRAHGISGWANVVCVPRNFAPAANAFRQMATALP